MIKKFPSPIKILTKNSGGFKGGARPAPLFLDQTESRRVEKIVLETASPATYLKIWIVYELICSLIFDLLGSFKENFSETIWYIGPKFSEMTEIVMLFQYSKNALY